MKAVTRWRRSLLRLAAPIAVALVSTSLLSAPAHAKGDNGLQFSGDGKSWSSEPPSVFASAPVLVPGETFSETFFVRNASGVPAFISVIGNVEAVNKDLNTQDAMQLRVVTQSLKGDLGANVIANAGDASCIAITSAQLAHADVRQVTAEVSLPWSARNAAQRAKYRVPLLIRGAELEAAVAAPSKHCALTPAIEKKGGAAKSIVLNQIPKGSIIKPSKLPAGTKLPKGVLLHEGLVGSPTKSNSPNGNGGLGWPPALGSDGPLGGVLAATGNRLTLAELALATSAGFAMIAWGLMLILRRRRDEAGEPHSAGPTGAS